MTEAMTANPLHVVFSDMHLGAGPRLPDGRPNRVDDFKGDAQFRRIIGTLLREHPGRAITLTQNGDFVDMQAIPLLMPLFGLGFLGIRRWRWKEVPTAAAALAKLELAIRAHPEVFEALRVFLRAHPDNRLRFTIGNHDQAFAWPEVQERLKREFGDLADRVLIGRSWRDGDVGTFHGAEVDSVNRVPEDERMFIKGRVSGLAAAVAFLVACATFLLGIRPIKGVLSGEAEWTWGNVALAIGAFIPYLLLFSWAWGRIRFVRTGGQMILNVKYASYMNAGMAMWLKVRFFPWIGRLQDHGPIWFTALARDWHYALAILPVLIAHLALYLALGKTTPAEAWRVMASTTHPDRVEEHLPELVHAHPGVRHFNFGHTHIAGFWSFSIAGHDVVVRNTGTGVQQVRLWTPNVAVSTPFRRVEPFLRRVAYHWRHATRAAVFFTAVHVGAAVALQAIDGLLGGPLGWINPAGTSVLLYLLLARQSYALYRGDEFVEWTPIFFEVGPDGTASIGLRRYDAEADAFLAYGEAPTR